ncbi:family A G protein-coupled receptor-like protein [Peniophora sp. CONT]|nr:family A G protein-coupled receptor-like protein [Peniophora sp. CONT]
MDAAPLAETFSSINSNPSNADIALTNGTTDWLWAVFALMFVSSLVFIGWSFTRPLGTRVFHQIPAIILMTASIAYFCMASNLGGTPVPVEYNGIGRTRAIWYVRYIDWTITTPLLLLELLLGTGLPLSDIVTVIFFDLVMIITGLIGSLVASAYKWAFFTGGMLALFYIWGVLIGGARTSAHLISPAAGRAFTGSAIFLSCIWLLYPVAWGLADGGNVLHPSGEMIFYGILDLLAKPVFCFWHASQMRKIPYESYALSSGKVSSGHNGALKAGALGAAAGAGATHHHDKQQAINGVSNGHNGGMNGTGVANGHNGVANGHNGVANGHNGVANGHNGVANGHGGVINDGAANGHHHHGAADATAGAVAGAAAEHHHDHHHDHTHSGAGAGDANGSISYAPGYDAPAHDSSITGAHLA